MYDGMRVYLVRHTRTEVPPGICYGWSDVDVADTFPQEAADVRRHLSGIEFDQAYTSPLRRAVKLADYCGFTTAIRDDRLKEMNMGRWEMQSYDKIDDPALQEWYKDYMHLPATGGESFPDLKRQQPYNFFIRFKTIHRNTPERLTIYTLFIQIKPFLLT